MFDPRAFESDAHRELARYKPKARDPRTGTPRPLVPLGYGVSAKGWPIRRFKDPKSGAIHVYGLDLEAYKRGRVKVRRLDARPNGNGKATHRR